MIRGYYTAATGLRAYQNQLNIISNNMANVNTVGFKSLRASFTDLLYQNLNRPEAENEAMVGHGVKIAKTDIDFSQGSLQSTSHFLDVALTEGNSFFMVETDNGDIRYTRDGAFRLSNDEGTFYLVDGNGFRVLNEDEEPIEIEFDEEDGSIIFDHETLGVARFPNPYGLELVGSNTYVETERSGEPELVEDPALKAGYLEGSAVDLSGEMVAMIEASKAFSFNSRMVQVADEVEQTVNNLR